MADIIPLHRDLPTVRAPCPEPAALAVQDTVLWPWMMLRLGVALWAGLWFAPLGLRVETVDEPRRHR